MFPLIRYCRQIDESSGAFKLSAPAQQLPTCAVVCNFPKPTDTQPALIPHKDVVTFFHEFGHAMHSICSKVNLLRFSGTYHTQARTDARTQRAPCLVRTPRMCMCMHSSS